MSEPPKLYVNKPKKAQLKQSRVMEAQSSTPSSSSSSSSSSTSSSIGSGGNGGFSKPPEVPKESFVRRYKFFLPLILSVNLAVGAYLFMRTKKKDVAVEEEIIDAPPTRTPSISAATRAADSVTPQPQPTKVQEPIPEQQQRELFKWILEEKRKIKPKDPEEKRRLDEEKAILKQFIRAKSIPSI